MMRRSNAHGFWIVLPALALAALAAPAASADPPPVLSGTDIEGKSGALTYPEEEGVSCPDSTYSAELNEAGNAYTVAPSYNNAACTMGGGAHKATVTDNGCDYVWHLGGLTEGDQYPVSADILCPSGKAIEMHIYFASGNENIQICKMTIAEQEGLEGTTLTANTEGGDYVLEGTLKGLSVVKTGLCGEGSTSEGSYDMAITLS